ncbi:restriction endonuclease subunit S [Campylobacter upsaliensis]|nr:restriction endonuclease subunit S [Campylobacter upsaliensis]
MKALNDNAHPLESLLQQHCPNGVEFKELGEVCETLPKGTLKTSQLTANGYPVINSGRDLYGYYSKFNNESNAFTIAARGEYAGFVNFMDSKFWAGGLCYPYRSNDENKLLTKFIYYHLKTNESNIMDSLVARGSIPAINKKDIDKKLKIPLPPLEIQYKIVEILDAFTELQAELQAELHARRKQYEYYRNKLLSFEELQRRTDMLNGGGLKLVTLGELGKRNAGTKITANQMQALHKENAPIRIFAGGSTIADVDYRDLPKKDVIDKPSIICKARGYIGFEYYDKPFSHKSEFWSYTIEKNANQKFIYYFLVNQQEYFQQIAKANSVKIPQLKVKNTDNFQISLPPLVVQNDIVELLDKFDTLTNDLTSGIPAEIEARKKQYEYYRERLLSFIAKD